MHRLHNDHTQLCSTLNLKEGTHQEHLASLIVFKIGFFTEKKIAVTLEVVAVFSALWFMLQFCSMFQQYVALMIFGIREITFFKRK